MLSPEEKMVLFKNECRLYSFHCEMLKQAEEQRERLVNRMMNVHSVNLERVGTSPSRKEVSLIPLIESKTALDEEIQYLNERIGWLKEGIDSIPSPGIRALIWVTYLMGESVQEAAEKLNMNVSHVYKLRKKHVLLMMSDEHTDRLLKLKEQENRSGDQAETDDFSD